MTENSKLIHDERLDQMILGYGRWSCFKMSIASLLLMVGEVVALCVLYNMIQVDPWNIFFAGTFMFITVCALIMTVPLFFVGLITGIMYNIGIRDRNKTKALAGAIINLAISIIVNVNIALFLVFMLPAVFGSGIGIAFITMMLSLIYFGGFFVFTGLQIKLIAYLGQKGYYL